jgi:A/G-specific adenine glycosylase
MLKQISFFLVTNYLITGCCHFDMDKPLNMPDISRSRVLSLRRKIQRFYRFHGRRLPFRETTDPYKIAVAEIMLQQTQVERVVWKYVDWIKRWPDWKSLASATPRQLLKAWSGLGYNRRAMYLGELARRVVRDYAGKLPDDPAVLRKLPGIGPYTAHAILIFAHNRHLAAIDTNVRRVLISELGLSSRVKIGSLEKIAIALVPRRSSRQWHNALMDYSRLVLPRRFRGSAPGEGQSRFEGSRRKVRGEIVRRLTLRRRQSIERLAKDTGWREEDIRVAAMTLRKDGLVRISGGYIMLAETLSR